MIIWHTYCAIIVVTDQIIRNPKIAFVIKTFLKKNYRSGQATFAMGRTKVRPLLDTQSISVFASHLSVFLFDIHFL
jgi:hypothetical protein